MPNTKPSVGEALSLEEIEYEEWLSVEDATFYIRLELSIELPRGTLIAIAKKFNCTSCAEDGLRIQRGPIVEVCRKLYFPDIPKGWKSLRELGRTYKISDILLQKWLSANKIIAQKFNIGLKEIWFGPEKEFRQYVIQQRNRKHRPGVVLHRKPLHKGRW